MKSFLKTALYIAIGCLMVASSNATDKKVDPTGTWTWTMEGRNGQTRTNTLVLKLEGDKLTGHVVGRGRQGNQSETPIEDAKIKGEEVNFNVTREFNGNKFVTKYAAKISGDTMKGKVTFGRNGETRDREFEAKRKAAK